MYVFFILADSNSSAVALNSSSKNKKKHTSFDGILSTHFL